MSERMLTYGDIALRLNCSIKTIRRAVRDNKLKGVIRINSTVVRVPESEVEKYIRTLSTTRHN